MIYHITRLTDWQAALASGSYQADSLTSQGFIHCSKHEQVLQVGSAFFKSQQGLVLLVIDPLRVRAEIRYENLEGGPELFPHIYGPLNIDAVTEVQPFEC